MALVLGFASILAGTVLTVSGITGSTLPSVAAGKPDRAKATPQGSTTTSSPATGGGAPGTGGSTSWQTELRAIAKEKGWNASAWEKIINLESGGDPKAVNASSGAFGLGQFLGATKTEYAKYGAESTNPVEQIRADAKYIEDRYHTPTAALTFHLAHGWY